MGLDITAYSKLKKVPCKFNSDGEPINDKGQDREGVFIPYAHSSFPEHHKGLTPKAAYEYGKSFDFRAGSYSGYNAWREQLAALAGYAAKPGFTDAKPHSETAWDMDSGPFWELINFSDCEGCIGPVVSAKLAKDFADYQAKADAHDDEYFRRKYSEWRKAFEMAADGGAVDFH